MTVEILAGVAVGILVGSTLTALGFFITYSSRLTKVEAGVSEIRRDIKEIKGAIHSSPCPASTQLHEDLALQEQRIQRLEAEAGAQPG